jgi:hypothetical protein
MVDKAAPVAPVAEVGDVTEVGAVTEVDPWDGGRTATRLLA